jgi:hypothetical protein
LNKEKYGMAERRPLAAAVNQFSGADPDQVRAFITQESRPVTSVPQVEKVEAEKKRAMAIESDRELHATPRKPAKRKATRLQPVGLIPVTIRLRPEIAGALKRASLERQLNGEETFTQQEIVENALEPWLSEEGYL